MGRWGDKIYDSDAALDFFSRLSDLLMREINYLLSPEQVKQSTAWIRDVIAVIEIMLLFDKNAVGTTSYFMDHEQAVNRWREVFFGAWDAEWEDSTTTYFPFHSCSYRKEHRQVINKWFDRLTEVATYFSLPDDVFYTGEDLSEFKPETVLPCFSLTFVTTSDGKTHPITGFVLGTLIERLVYSIVFVLSDENRKMAIGLFEIEDVWVAVDVIALLCESYSISPSVTYDTVEIWQQKMTDIWKARLAEESMEWGKDENLYKNVVSVFDKLRILAQKYPPMFA